MQRTTNKQNKEVYNWCAASSQPAPSIFYPVIREQSVQSINHIKGNFDCDIF